MRCASHHPTPPHLNLSCSNFGPYPDWAAQQLAFVEADLQQAVQNRQQRPWIVAYGHRPMYCSDTDDDSCTQNLDSWKTDLENLFMQYKVDVVIEAHQHSFEMLWPVYNFTVMNGSLAQPFTNAGAPIHIVSGAAGCDEDLDPFGPEGLGPWSAFRSSTYGYEGGRRRGQNFT